MLRSVILGTVGLVAVSASCSADSGLVGALTAPAAEPHGWYIGADGAARVQQLPDIDLLHDSIGGGKLVTSDPTVIMGGGAATLGYVFGKQLDPQLWGGRAHVAATAYYFEGSDHENLLSSTSQSAYSVRLDDQTLVGITDPTAFSVETDYSDWGVVLRGGLDFDAGEGLVLTPSLALLGGRTHLSQGIALDENPEAPLPHFADYLSSDIDNTRLGVGFGLGATYGIAEGWTLRGGAQVVASYNWADGRASECYGTPVSDGQCNAAYAGQDSVNLSDRHFGVQVGGGLGIAYDLGFATVGLNAEASYDSYVPTLDWGNNPGETAKIADGGAFSYGGGIAVTVPLN